MRSGNGLRDAAAGGDVVFLDQEGVIQADAVVVATAAGYGVLLRQAQPRQRFAGVEQLDLSLGHEVRQVLRAGRHAGEQLQEVQGAAFAGQQ
ncbi:hypothetical protein D3C78_1296370 [compost metagenome]